MSAGSGASASAAAAAAAQRMREEEEEMTPYRSEELAEDWEFKILRSMTGAFKKPEKLRRVLEEEARPGWVLVEKFDNGRLRLKRPARAKQASMPSDLDPYRTYVGPSEGKFVLIVLACVFAGLGALAGLIALVVALAS